MRRPGLTSYIGADIVDDKIKEVVWLGTSQQDIRARRATLRRLMGMELYRVQLGEDPIHFRPMPKVGKGAFEIRAKDEFGISRLIYVPKFDEAIYVLHVFDKRTEQTANVDLKTASTRYREMEQMRTK